MLAINPNSKNNLFMFYNLILNNVWLSFSDNAMHTLKKINHIWKDWIMIRLSGGG